ncbi:putative two-component sensor histidine kinase [Paenibacillus agaridevorans]|uniref:histidine kinase n=2 Tax=Paenibacillus agaridevorans TaxID=171404 RepID=A0A2R5ERL6_9BACL|nr:putative two-component sensor histidine kinase [Paenibacillus agaridevorans]
MTIKDQGKGIPPEHQAQVFERVDRGRTGEGLGIGLSIVKDIVDAHQGSIRLESSPDVETVFRIRLPRD